MVGHERGSPGRRAQRLLRAHEMPIARKSESPAWIEVGLSFCLALCQICPLLLRLQGKDVARARNMKSKLLQAMSTWHCVNLANMSTIMREWVALHRIDSVFYKDVLIR